MSPVAIRSVVVAVALPVFFSAGCKKAPPAQQQGPLPVNFQTVEEKVVMEWDEFTGRMEAVESVEIRPRVSGYLTEIHFKAGALVKKGDPLFVIDPRPYKADLDRAVAELERAAAQLKLAQIELDRAKELRDKNTIAASEFDVKAANYQVASAAVRSATAAKESAALNLEFTRITSPIDGRVSNERVTVGNLIQPGSGADSILTTVVSIDPIYVYVDADENTVLKYIKLNEQGKRKTARDAQLPAFVQLGNETGFPHQGVVDFVDNRVDAETGTLRARIVLKAWDPLLAPGFFVRARMAGAETSKAALVEDKVIGSQQGVKFAFVIKPDNTIERRNLETGPLFEGKRIVRNGLKQGERVVSTRLQLLQPGMPVQPIPEAPPATPAPASEAKAAPEPK